MTECDLILCDVLAYALFGKELQKVDVDWNELFQEMRVQAVQGIVINHLKRFSIPEEIRMEWKKEAINIIYSGASLCNEQTKLVTLLENNNIPYIIIKGAAAAINYPDLLLRSMGDIDLYVPVSHYDHAAELMRNNGYVENLHDAYNHRHLSFKKEDVCFELHRTYVTVNDKKAKEYVDGLLNVCCVKESTNEYEIGWRRYVDNELNFRMPSVYVNGLVLLEHIAHHLIGGIGLRQIIDWLMYVSIYLDDEHWYGFRIMASEAGLETLAKVTTRMGQLYLGLPEQITWCKDVAPDVCQEFIEYIFANGNFGKKQQETRKFVGVMHQFTGVKGFFVNLQESGKYNWKAYKKYHWLKPFAWIYQFGRYMHQVLLTPKALQKVFFGFSEMKRRELLMSRLDVHNITIEEKHRERRAKSKAKKSSFK